jgi:hypothetical protein
MLTGEWQNHTVTQSDIPTPCEGACSCCIGNTIYSFGGETGYQKYTDKLYKLDLDEMKWKTVEGTGMKPDGRFAAAMCQTNKKLMLMGGYGPLPHTIHPQAQYKESFESGCWWNNELFDFDPHTDCWSALAVTGSKPCPRENHTLTAVDDNRSVLFGGEDGDTLLNDLWLFDYGKKVWTQMKPSSSLWPQPRYDHTVCTLVCDNYEVKLLLMGGHNKGVLEDCWLIDVLQGTGEKVLFDGEAVRRRGHSAHSVLLVDGTVVVSVFGGHMSSRVVSNPCFYLWSKCMHIAASNHMGNSYTLVRSTSTKCASV